jgi:hypothetical protein
MAYVRVREECERGSSSVVVVGGGGVAVSIRASRTKDSPACVIVKLLPDDLLKDRQQT